jgi:hypothetical protein
VGSVGYARRGRKKQSHGKNQRLINTHQDNQKAQKSIPQQESFM